jgi:hypothetical protein
MRYRIIAALSLLVWIRVHAADPRTTVLADLRAPLPPPPQLSAAQARRVSAAAFGKPVADATVNGIANGAFTAPGAQEVLYLVQPGGPQAAIPSAQSAVLLVEAGGQPRARLGTNAGTAIQAVCDVDGDGTLEVLLRKESFQMGQLSVRLNLVSLKNARAQLLHSFEHALEDRCADARFGGDIEALVIRLGAPAAGESPVFVEQRYRGLCDNGVPPPAERFQPIP